MIFYSKVTDAPETEPVSVAQAQEELRVSGDATVLAARIKAARRMCEAYAGLSFVTQERTIMLDKFPKTDKYQKPVIYVPYGPVQSIESITYVDSDGNDQELTENTDFIVDTNSELCRLSPVDSWPSTKSQINAVTIVYTAGVADDSEELATARLAILKQVATHYENRQDEVVTNAVSSSTVLCFGSREVLDTIKIYWNANAD